MANPRPILAYATGPMKQSRWGLASVTFSVTCVLSAIVATALNMRLGIHGDVLPLWLLVSVGVSVLSLFAGLFCGIAGVLQTRRRRATAIAGLTIAALFVLAFMAWTGLRHK